MDQSTPPDQHAIFARNLQAVKDSTVQRGNLCAVLVVLLMIVGSFLAPFDIVLVTLQVPCLLALVMFLKKPSLAKPLLIQQHLGIASLIVCFIKTFWLVLIIIMHILSGVLTTQSGRAVYLGNKKTVLTEIFPVNLNFPNVIPLASNSESSFVGVTLAIYGSIVILMELLSLIVLIKLFTNTRRLIKLLQGWDIDTFLQNNRRREEIELNFSSNVRTERPSANATQDIIDGETSRMVLYNSNARTERPSANVTQDIIDEETSRAALYNSNTNTIILGRSYDDISMIRR